MPFYMAVIKVLELSIFVSFRKKHTISLLQEMYINQAIGVRQITQCETKYYF